MHRGLGIAAMVTLPFVAACELAASGLGATDDPVADASAALVDGGRPAVDAATADAGAQPEVDATTPVADASIPDGPTPAVDAGGPDACAPTTDTTAMQTTLSIAPAPRIDGDLSDWPCAGHVLVTAANAAFVKSGGDAISADVALRWDKDDVYVAVHVTDPNVGGNDGTDPYKNDSVEIYVTGDAAPNGDYDAFSHQLVIDWKGLVVDYGPSHDGQPGDTKPQHFQAATRPMPDGWALEAMVGRQMFMTGPLGAGTSIGLDLEINDGDGTQQVGALVTAMASPLPACSCQQTQCCCGKAAGDLPYCDSARIARTTLK